MPVGFERLLAGFHVEVQCLDFFQDIVIDWNFVIPDNQSFGLVVQSVLSPPRMLFHLGWPDTLLWVHCEHFLEKIFKVARQMTWD